MYNIMFLFVLTLMFSSSKSVTTDKLANEFKSLKPILPNIVFVRLNESESMCSGLFLTEKWVLTAAHCVSKDHKNPLVVYIGRSKADIAQIEYSDSDVIDNNEISEVLIPLVWKDKVSSFGQSDIALVKLKETRPVTPLGRNLYAKYTVSKGQKCVMIGSRSHNSTEKVDLTVEGQYIAVQQYCYDYPEIVKSKERRYVSWLCQDDNKFYDDGFTDSGAFLFCDDSEASLMGIAAGKIRLTEDTNRNLEPVVFISVCPYLSWIHSYVGDRVPQSPGEDGSECFSTLDTNSCKDSKRVTRILLLSCVVILCALGLVTFCFTE